LTCNPGAAADAAFLTADMDRTGKRCNDSLRKCARPCFGVETAGDDDKFISADTRDHLFRPDDFEKTGRRGLQYLVSRRMAERIVDLFEKIEIDMDEGKFLRKIGRIGIDHELVQIAPVREAGQRIVERLMFENPTGRAQLA